MKILPLAAAISAALLSSNVMAELAPVEFHGYMRAGVGVSDGGGQQVQFNKNDLGRLGNESDVYGEIALGKEVFNDDGVSFKVNSMIAIASDGSNDWEGTKEDDSEFALRQFNVEAKGVLGFAPEATLWAGKRYNQRHDVHITDFYYWDVSGAGAGIDHIKAGPGQLSVAWVRSDRSDVADTGNANGALNVNILDARYAGIQLWDGMSLEVGIDYAITNGSDTYTGTDPKNGVLLTSEFTQSVMGGFNKTVFQYGTEGYGKALAYGGAGNWYGAEAQDGAKGYRVINHGVVNFTDKIDMSHMIRYSSADEVEAGQTNDITNFSIVVRPSYQWTEHQKTILEAGYFDGEYATGSKAGGQKYTIAQAWTAGSNFWARPEIRVYASYLKNDENTTAFNGGDTEANFGVQAEAWW
ncbi:maltoporin [Psychromonas aquimarina]|uniref:maltoporin n=1 Tax=Psychromonas aquimarina TaxID=444919 RepID=UPI0003FAE915|nr:maltoporin [Psychromonas aquimarina]